MLSRDRNMGTKIRDHLDRNYSRYAFGVSLLIPIGMYFLGQHVNINTIILDALKDKRTSFYGTIASIAGSLLGFIITGISIILAFATLPPLKRLRQSPYYKDIYSSYISSIRALAVLTIISVVGLLLDTDSGPNLVIVYILIGSVSLAILTLSRSIWILESFISIIVGLEALDNATDPSLPPISEEEFEEE